MRVEDCKYANVFGEDVVDFHRAFTDPKTDSYELFNQNKKYNVIFSQSRGVWGDYFEKGDCVVEDVTGGTRCGDPRFLEQFELVYSSHAIKSFPLNSINLVRSIEIANPANLVGKKADSPYECYSSDIIQKYVRIFNRTSLNLVAERLNSFSNLREIRGHNR